MAIQNFLSGGYYGKLGQTIGERWKNKRTIKSYAIPKNPRTEKQQANRGRFGSSVKLSQLAQAACYRSILFASDSNTEWGLRMSVAKTATDKGIVGLDAVPLCPNGFVPQYLITKAILQNPNSADAPILELDGTLPAESQILAILINDGEEIPGIENTAIMYSEFNPSTKTVILPESLAGKVKQGQKVRIISYSQSLSISEIAMSYALDIESSALPEFWLTSDKMSFSQDSRLKKLILAVHVDASASGIVNLQVTYNYGLNSTAVTDLVLPLKNDAKNLYVEFETPNSNDVDSLSSYVTASNSIRLISVAIQSTNYNYKTNGAEIQGADYECSDIVSLSPASTSNRSVLLEDDMIDWGSVGSDETTEITVLSNQLYGYAVETPQQTVSMNFETLPSAEGYKLALVSNESEQFSAFSSWCKIGAFSVTKLINGIKRTFSLVTTSSFSNDIKETTATDKLDFVFIEAYPDNMQLDLPFYGLSEEEIPIEANFSNLRVEIKRVSANEWTECELDEVIDYGTDTQLSASFLYNVTPELTDGETVAIRISRPDSTQPAKFELGSDSKVWDWQGSTKTFTTQIVE